MSQHDIENMPNDPAELKSLLKNFLSKNDKLSSEINQLSGKIEELKYTNAILSNDLTVALYRLYGRKSEKTEFKHDPDLFDEIEEYSSLAEDDVEQEVSDTKCDLTEGQSTRPEHGESSAFSLMLQPQHNSQKKEKKSNRGRKPIPAGLERVEVEHKLPDSERLCPAGHERKIIGTSITEELDLQPPKLRVLKHIRYTYGNCSECETGDKPLITTAPKDKKLIPGSMASEALLAYVIASKFSDGIPFDRQAKIFGRYGEQLNQRTLSNLGMRAAEKCFILLNHLEAGLLESDCIHVDETRVQVMREEDSENTSDSQMWVFLGRTGAGKPVVLFKYHKSRGAELPLNVLKGYRGAILTDGWQGYDTVSRELGIVHAGCWVHVRRKFDEAVKTGKKKSGSPAHIVLGLIAQLYRLETEIKKHEISGEEIVSYRQEKSLPVVEKLKAYLDKKALQAAPAHYFGKAVKYALNQWHKLTLFLDHSAIGLDNNPVENAIRPFVIGRKNWLFSGSPRGADASANLYTLIETAKANGLDPYWYLRFIFKKLPYAYEENDYQALLPMNVTVEQLAEYFSEK